MQQMHSMHMKTSHVQHHWPQSHRLDRSDQPMMKPMQPFQIAQPMYLQTPCYGQGSHSARIPSTGDLVVLSDGSFVRVDDLREADVAQPMHMQTTYCGQGPYSAPMTIYCPQQQREIRTEITQIARPAYKSNPTLEAKAAPGDLVVLADGSLVRAADLQQFSPMQNQLQQHASGTLMGNLIYAGWVYKRGGGLSSCYGGVAAYSRRYFLVTASGCLEYYKSKDKSAQMLPPRNSLVCIGMQVEEGTRKETIRGHECVTFVVTAKQGTRTTPMECACESAEERSKLLQAIAAMSTREDSGPTSAFVKGYLACSLMEGRGIEAGTFLARTKSFAIIRLQNTPTTFTTPRAMSTGSAPKWGKSGKDGKRRQGFPIPATAVHESCQELEVQVFDKCMFRQPKLMGKCSVQLQDIMTAQGGSKIDAWYRLDSKGELRLCFNFLANQDAHVGSEGSPALLHRPSMLTGDAGSGGVLSITIKCATGIRMTVDDAVSGVTTWDTVDPFVVVSYHERSFRTKTVYNNPNPTFNETVRFHVRGDVEDVLGRTVRLAVYDRDSFSSQCLSVCTVLLSELIPNEGRMGAHVSLERDLLPNASRWGAKFAQGPVMGKIEIVSRFEPFVEVEKRFWLEWFSTVDTDGSGDLQLPEFTEFVSTVSGKELAPDEVKRLFDAANRNNDDSVDLKELSDFLVERHAKTGQSFVDDALFEAWLRESSHAETGMVCADSEAAAANASVGGLLSFMSDWNCDESYSKGLNVGSKSRHILVWTRYSELREEETISPAINLGMRMLYQGAIGAMLRKTSSVTASFKAMSVRQGVKYDSPQSAGHIQEVVDSFQINMEEAELPVPAYTTFNEWFCRKLKAGARPIAKRDDPAWAVQPCDCRLMVFPTVDEATKLWIKGKNFSLTNLLGSPELGAHFKGGSVSVHRLAPQDYHRYHLPIDACTIESRQEMGDKYWTVNPVAVNLVDVFTENKRVVSILQSAKFGKVAFVSVGAHMVATIEFTKAVGESGNKGDDFGFFKFGGSTVVCVWEKDAIVFDKDLLARSQESTEVLVQMGQTLGYSPR